MKNGILVSIVIVTFDAEKTISDCLDSVKEFIDGAFEVILVDGRSNDKTLAIIENYRDIVSVLISEEDFGIYDAMNKGVSKASGDYIYFLGSDDTLAMNFKDLYGVLLEGDTIYYGDVNLVPINKIYGGRFSTFDIINRNLCHQSIFYPREVFNSHKYGSEFKYMEDYSLNLKLWASSRYKFQYINFCIANYRIDGSSSMNIDAEFKRKSFRIIFSYFGILGLVLKLMNPFQNFVKRII
jgi:glycosyltransferase involved in cell wall biosynthesis